MTLLIILVLGASTLMWHSTTTTKSRLRHFPFTLIFAVYALGATIEYKDDVSLWLGLTVFWSVWILTAMCMAQRDNVFFWAVSPKMGPPSKDPYRVLLGNYLAGLCLATPAAVFVIFFLSMPYSGMQVYASGAMLAIGLFIGDKINTLHSKGQKVSSFIRNGLAGSFVWVALLVTVTG